MVIKFGCNSSELLFLKQGICRSVVLTLRRLKDDFLPLWGPESEGVFGRHLPGDLLPVTEVRARTTDHLLDVLALYPSNFRHDVLRVLIILLFFIFQFWGNIFIINNNKYIYLKKSSELMFLSSIKRS